MPENHPRIAIVGAGLGGLLCAVILRGHGIDTTVFEGDPEPDHRAQGGSLDLDEHTGQAALRAAGLHDAFLALARPEGQEVREYDRTGRLVNHEDAPASSPRPEIDRTQLRGILLSALGEGEVRWGTPVSEVAPSSGGRARVTLGTGGTEEFDLVVGADGAWSKVRPAVSDARPFYTGNTLVETWFTDVDRLHPELAATVGHGIMLAVDAENTGHLIIGQRNGDHTIRVCVGLKCEEDWAERAAVDLSDSAAVRAHFTKLFAGWHDDLLRAIHDTKGPFINRPVHRLPYPHTWKHHPAVTLLGDAAHLMPPAGQGANLALLDAADLAGAIRDAVADGSALGGAVARYEEIMQPRGAIAAEQSARALEQ
ncbi:NAD(P)/FAD-dependent oxidoreductase [Streptomyces xanthochromogenes]|uniref:FAD-dependent oxidoreductase n=1 Tax=Streptomyces xanthochromogenes TaxID=67384 RepID=UPI0034226A7C